MDESTSGDAVDDFIRSVKELHKKRIDLATDELMTQFQAMVKWYEQYYRDLRHCLYPVDDRHGVAQIPVPTIHVPDSVKRHLEKIDDYLIKINRRLDDTENYLQIFCNNFQPEVSKDRYSKKFESIGPINYQLNFERKPHKKTRSLDLAFL